MKIKKYITYGEPTIGNEEINSVIKVIKSRWIGSGPVTQRFEKKFKQYKKSKYCLAINSCTAGLHLSLMAMNIKSGDEVITTPLTFCSTINSILLVGAKPVLVDINPSTLNIDEEKIKKKVTKKTKAIVLVHFGGLPCNLYPIINLAKKYKLKIIEDCAHAIESKYYGKHVGNFGSVGCFSFYANKNLTTGEGGMLLTNNLNISSKIHVTRLHGLSKDAWKRYLPESVNPKRTKFEHYDVVEVGLKYNMIDLNAAMGIVQLSKIEKSWRNRRKNYRFYIKRLKHLPVLFQKIDSYPVKHAHHLFTIRINNKRSKKKRDNLIEFLKKNNIGTGVNYRCVTDMSYYKKNLGWNKNTCKNAKQVGDNIVSLPMQPTLTRKKINYICDKVCEFFQT
jgi:dTDP-4-amino-4,6-dideoxygalactose transaminase|tara:strand:- start:9 stop:1184 length:1176 start_codon:yes stop_codon:yes gene_type:complete